MSGHSKWSTIKHKKAALDSKKGKVFGQISKMIRIAVKEASNGDPAQNPALRLALEKARAVNMPKVNIDRAIEKGLGKSSTGAIYEEVIYEGFGPSGVGIMVRTVTDNRNRTSAEVRSMMEKAGGSMGGPGSVSYMIQFNVDGTYKVTIPMPFEDIETKNRILSLIEDLEELEDVEQVAHNMA